MARKKSDDSDDKEYKPTGTVAPGDRPLAEWIARKWAGLEHPQKIMCFRMTGQNNSVRDQQVFCRVFRENTNIGIEEAGRIANEIQSDAQDHCNRQRIKKGTEILYNIIVEDRNIQAGQFVEKTLRLRPVVTYSPAALGEGEAASGSDEGDALKPIAERQAELIFERERWKTENESASFGQFIQFTWTKFEAMADRYLNLAKAYGDHLQQTRRLDIEDKDHEPARVEAMAVAKIKDAAAKGLADGMDIVKNLILGAQARRQLTAGAVAPTNGTQPAPPSILRMLLADTIKKTEAAKVDEKLFGRAEDGKLVERGIFSQAQGELLVRVRDGEWPESRLWDFLADSGHALAVTGEQLADAKDALKGHDAILFGIATIIGICTTERDQHRASQQSTQAAAAQQGEAR